MTNPPYHQTINKLLHAILQYFKGSPETMTTPQPPYYNVTNDLLYAILNTLNTSPVYSQFRVLYVSARYGNDSTAQVNSLRLPYKTITAAKNNAFGNDIIHVMEGIYDEGNLFGSYFYWFDYGAEINYTGAGAIFQQWFGQCTVRGFGKFKSNAGNCVVNVGGWLFCLLDMECESIEGTGQTVMFWQNVFFLAPLYKPHKVKCRRIYSSGGPAVMFRAYSNATVIAEEIVSDSFTDGTIWLGSVIGSLISGATIISSNFVPVNFLGTGYSMTFENCNLVSNYDSPAGHGIYTTWQITDLFLYKTRIYCKNPGAKSISTSGNTSLHLDSNVRANTDTGGAGILTYVNKGTKIQLDESEATIDITGLASIDLAGFQNAEVIRVSSSNAAETITQVINAPLHHSFKLLPDAGLSLTINSADPLLAAQADIILESASITLNGDKGDWLELQSGLFGTGNRQINASNY